MAIFLPVAPPNILKMLGTAVDTPIPAFLLAHEVVKDPDAYRDPESKYTCRILDNSVIELGGAVDLPMVQEAANICNPSIVVLPDVLEDGEATSKAVIEAYASWEDAFPNSRLMFVPQGRDILDWIKCLERVLNEVNYHAAEFMVGIPRNTPGRICNSRRDLVHLVNQVAPHVKIHLLGYSNNPLDDILTASDRQIRNVVSIDSAAPFRGTQPALFGVDPGPRGNWWDEVAHLDQSELDMGMCASYMYHSAMMQTKLG